MSLLQLLGFSIFSRLPDDPGGGEGDPPYAIPSAKFIDVFRRMARELRPMGPQGVLSVPHNINQWWVRPDASHIDPEFVGPIPYGMFYETAWPGIASIDWSKISSGGTLWVCGTFEEQDFDIFGIQAPSVLPLDVRFDYTPDPGIIYKSVEIPTEDWTASGVNGEYYITGIDQAELMLYASGVRLIGCSKSSGNTKNVRFVQTPVTASISLVDSSITFASIERPYADGEKVYIPATGELDGIPAPLARNTAYYVIALATNQIQFASSYANAMAHTPITLTDAGNGNIWKLFHEKRGDGTYEDPEVGSLAAGEYWWEGEQQRLYYKPPGSISDHVMRLSDDRNAHYGAAMYLLGCANWRIFGGGEYGGRFGVAPKGKVGQCHTNAIQIVSSNNMEVNGLEIAGCRSGIAFVGGTGHTTRNNRVSDSGWHGIGGESGTVYEDHMLHERNWVSDVGRKHDFGDTQGIIFNRRNDYSIIRRNLLERVGRDNLAINTGVIVIDTSDYCHVYRNILDDCHGGQFEVGSGNSGEVRTGSTISSNIVTRDNRTMNGAGNEANFKPWIVSARVQKANVVLENLSVFGNLFAKGQNPAASWYSEQRGVFLMRNANFVDAIIRDLSFRRNAVLDRVASASQFIYVLETRTTGLVVPTFTADYNLYTNNTKFYNQYHPDTGTVTYTAAQALGIGSGFWSTDSGQDKHSVMLAARSFDWDENPITAEVLEFLRQDDLYDTLDTPTEALVGSYPFD